LFWLFALFAFFLWLSYTNFKHLVVTRRLWLQNALVLLSVVVSIYGAVAFLWEYTRYL
jgi:hypothetical protein